MQKKRIAIAIAAIVFCTMVFGSVSVSAASATLGKEAQGSNVKELQEDLIRLGYLSADATGYYGNATEEAVKKLQKEYGYEADGIAGNTTLSLVDRLLGRGKTTAVSSSQFGCDIKKVDSALKDGDALVYLSSPA